MKRNYINLITITLLAVIGCSLGCKKITDINVSPNNPPIADATPQVLFPSGVQSTAGRVGGELAILGGIWSQYWTQANSSNQFKSIDAYQLGANDFGNLDYQELFAGALQDYQLAITKAKALKEPQFYLMATVMKAYTFEVLVDLYDKVPYTQAFQGRANLQPKFDDGYTVYQGLLKEIDSALTASASATDLLAVDAPNDFVFAGNMAKWTAFANTLKLKMYLRMVNAQPAAAQAGINALYASKAVFLDVDAEAGGYNAGSTTLDEANPLYDYNARLNTPDNLKASRTFVSWLQDHNDNRINEYYGSAAPTVMNQGDFNATAVEEPTYASATTVPFSPTAPVPFISAAESYFLQAEAAERYNGGVDASGNTAAKLFTDGINASFAYYGETPPAAGSDTAYEYPATGTFKQKLRRIIIQKWASFLGSHALEGFFEQERTGYPEHTPPTPQNNFSGGLYSTDPTYVENYPGYWVFSPNAATIKGQFPKRLVFPAVERTVNPNTPAEVPITTPVWWGLTTGN